VLDGKSAGLDSAFLVERELLAQKEILGRERAFGSQPEKQEAEHIGTQVQPARAEIHDAPISFLFDLLLSLWLLFSPFQVRPLIFAKHSQRITGIEHHVDY
jgi:hypothetical protein